MSGDAWVAWIVLPLFALVGAAGVIAGIRTMLGKPAKPGQKKQTLGVPVRAGRAKTAANGYYELDPDMTPAGKFIFLLIATLFWNGITWGLMAPKVFEGFRKDNIEVMLTLALVLFAAAGLAIAYGAAHSLLHMCLTGTSHIRSSVRHAAPGSAVTLMVMQSGRFTITSLNLTMICVEEARYRRGTDTVTKTETVREIPVCAMQNLQARDGQVIAQPTLNVPPDAMHSFESDNNKVSWYLQLKMVIPGRPDTDQKFYLPVMPAAQTTA